MVIQDLMDRGAYCEGLDFVREHLGNSFTSQQLRKLLWDNNKADWLHWFNDHFPEAEKTPTTKYKVGDKVRVRKDLELHKSYYMENREAKDSVTKEMMELMGKEVVIKEILSNGKYRIENFDLYLNWTDEMFESITDDFYVKLSDNLELRKVQSTLLQETAFKNGWKWKWGSTNVKDTAEPYLYFSFKNGITYGDLGKDHGCQLVSLEQALELLNQCKTEKIEPKKFQWTDVPKEVIKKVYEKWVKRPTNWEICDLCRWILEQLGLIGLGLDTIMNKGWCPICPAYPDWCKCSRIESKLSYDAHDDKGEWDKAVDSFLAMLIELDPELKKEIYKTGDIFLWDGLGGRICILNYFIEKGKYMVTLNGVKDGDRFYEPVEVKDIHAITEEEFNMIIGDEQYANRSEFKKLKGSFKEIFGEPKGVT